MKSRVRNQVKLNNEQLRICLLELWFFPLSLRPKLMAMLTNEGAWSLRANPKEDGIVISSGHKNQSVTKYCSSAWIAHGGGYNGCMHI